jgi:hypothetical protein
MSVQKLINANEKVTSYTYADEPIYLLPSTNVSDYKESRHSFNPPSGGEGLQTQLEIFFQKNEFNNVRGMITNFNVINSSATEQPIFYNKYLVLRSARMTVNSQELSFLQDQHQIMRKVSSFMSKYPEQDIYTGLAQHRNEITKTFNGDAFTVSTTTRHSIDLFVLFPELKSFTTQYSGISRIFIELAFQANNNSLLNNMFCRSNTTNNAYGTNISFSNIECVLKYTKHYDAKLFKMISPPMMIVEKSLTKQLPSQSWNSVGVDNFSVNLFNDFFKQARCTGLSIYFFDVAGNSAYNSSNSAKFVSGPEYYSYVIRKGSDILVDHSKPIEDLTLRRQYFLNNWKDTYANEMPLELLNKSTPLADYYIQHSLPLVTTINDSYSPSVNISGRSNTSNDYEILFTCAQAISANVNIFYILNYIELSQVDPASGLLKKFM